MFIHWTKLKPGKAWESFKPNSSLGHEIDLLNRLSRSDDSSSAGIKSKIFQRGSILEITMTRMCLVSLLFNHERNKEKMHYPRAKTEIAPSL